MIEYDRAAWCDVSRGCSIGGLEVTRCEKEERERERGKFSWVPSLRETSSRLFWARVHFVSRLARFSRPPCTPVSCSGPVAAQSEKS